MQLTGKTLVLGILGDPIQHSLSPRMPSTRVLPVNCMSFVSALISRVTAIKIFPILDHISRREKLPGKGNIVQHS